MSGIQSRKDGLAMLFAEVLRLWEENERFCLDEVVKKQLEKLDCFTGWSHLLPGCFGLSLSSVEVTPAAMNICLRMTRSVCVCVSDSINLALELNI